MSEIENKNQNQSDEIDLIEVFHKIWDGRKTIFKWMGIFFVIGIIIIIFSPKEYKSEVTLLVETGSGSNGMGGLLQQFGGLAGINLGAGAGEDALTPELYPDIIKSTPFLLEVMDQKVTESKYDSTLKVSEYIQRHTRPSLGSLVMGYTIGLPRKVVGFLRGEPNQSSDNNLIEGPLKLTQSQSDIAIELSKRMRGKVEEPLGTLVISVQMQDPKAAAIFVDLVIKSLTRYIIEYRTQKAKIDLQFVEGRHAEAETKFRLAQKNLASYRDRNKNLILASALTSEQNLQAEYNLAFNIFNTLSQQLEQAKMKLQEKTPVFKVVEPAMISLKKDKPKTSLVLIVTLFMGICFGSGVLLFKGQFQKIWNSNLNLASN
jgi:uncharacterized protein involved in exopolysaccharide biosynthesis